MKNAKILCSVCSLALLAGADLHAEAQEGETLVLEEIIVSAQRRDESLSGVPVSVTALSSENIESMNLVSTTDLQVVAPGLTVTHNAAFPLLFIRGVGTDIQSPGVESSVAVYVDGVYQSQTGNILKNMSNVERVEVLKGPQGTLYGRNATGGAINIITKAPSEEWTGSIEAGTGDKSLFETSGFISGPVSDNVRFALSGQYYDKDGYNTNIVTGQNIGDEHYYSFDGKIDVDFSENFNIRLMGNYFKRDDTYSSTLNEVSGTSLPAALGFTAVGDPRTLSVNQDGLGSEIESYTLGVKAQLATPYVDITSITSYMDFKILYRIDFDLSTATLVHFRPDHYGDAFTQEFQFTPGYDVDRLDWIVGAFYLKDDTGFDPFLYDTTDPMFGPVTVTNTARVITDAFAVFGEATYDITDKLSFTGGLRYSYEDKSLEDREFGILGLAVQGFPNLSESWDDFNYRAVLKYDMGDTMMYAKHETGFKSGTFNTANPATPGPVDPENIKAYELGLKTKLFDNRVSLNTALFYNDYKNLQIQIIDTVSGGSSFDQAPKAETYGFDLEINALVSENLRVFAGANYLHAEYEEYISAGALVPNPIGGNVPQPGLDLSGKKLMRSPEFTFNVGAQFSVPLEAGELTANVNYYHSSRIYFDPANISSQGAYGLLDANIEFRHADSGFSMMVWGKNLTDEDYLFTKVVGAMGIGGGWADPVSYGVRVKYSF